MKNEKVTVRFQLELNPYGGEEATLQGVEAGLEDLLKRAVLPALNVELVPLSFEVKKARK
jgi:hypothetical protein